MPRCWQMLCHGEQQGVGATDADYSVSIAVSPRATRRKCSATWVFAAYETLSSRCALRHHDRIQANAVSQRAARVLMLRSLNYRLRDAVSMGRRRRNGPNGGASVSGADGVHEASETLSSSFTLRHHAWMQAIPVSQESCVDVGAAAAELPLGGCCICARCARNGGASDSAAHGAHEAETLSSSLALRDIDQAQANAVSQRAALVLMPRSLIDSVSSGYRWAAGAENRAHLFRGQLGRLQRMGR